MIQRKHPTAYPFHGASGLIAQLGGLMRRLTEFLHVGISNSGGLSYGSPPFAETDPQDIAGSVKFVAPQSTAEIV